MRDFAEIWRKAQKVVYSTTLVRPITERTSIERRFDLSVVGRMKEQADRDIAVGGPTLAALALRGELVDECHRFLAPVVVGSGLRCFPATFDWISSSSTSDDFVAALSISDTVSTPVMDRAVVTVKRAGA
jgi:dihydrofolate reductase